MIIVDLSIIIIGLISGLILFFDFPIIKREQKISDPKISIVIPCRNEEKNIGQLLTMLKSQTLEPFEIICVNDQSEDKTKEIIQSLLDHINNLSIINLADKPNGWNGKPYALTQGAKAANGDVILFLDADVKLNDNALEILLSNYSDNKALSVQPYHKTEKLYESLSIFFNLVAVAGTGITLPKKKQIGMFGPILMINKDLYLKMGCHEPVKTSIIEDIELGNYYKEKNTDYDLTIGNKDISFRMYAEGLKSQYQGFVKNLSQGAIASGYLTIILTVLWITAMTSISLNLLISFSTLNLENIVIFFLFYVFATCHLFAISYKIGKFHFLIKIFYPIPLLWFILVFLISLTRKLFFKTVTWKGRKIKI